MQLETFLEQSARQAPDKIALICGKQRLTYHEVETACNRLAHGLVAAGVERGDRVAIYLDNSVEAVLSVFAVLKAGAVFLMVNPTTKIEKLTYILNNSRAKALICPARKAADLDDCSSQLPHLETIIQTGPSSSPS